MSCTQETYEALLAAQRNIAAGTNVVRVRIDGEETEFGQGNIALLTRLINDCQLSLGLLDADDGYSVISTCKGFGCS